MCRWHKDVKTMSDMMSLVAEDRTAVGKGAARATREAGRVPGVVYGEKKEQLMFSLEAPPEPTIRPVRGLETSLSSSPASSIAHCMAM